jgi:hypothetical protein
MGNVMARSKRASAVREAGEFDTRALRTPVAPPPTSCAIYSWSLESIYAARDAQMLGNFSMAASLAQYMRTDDAIAVPLENRLAPQECVRVQMVAAGAGKAESISNEAEALFGERGIGLSPQVVGDIHACLVDHEIAITHTTMVPRDDGSRWDVDVQLWPIEHVRWDEHRKQLFARVGMSQQTGNLTTIFGEVPIVHGDGRWTVFSRRKHKPWRHASLLAACLVWARHAFAIRDWSKASVSHGNAKIVGEMREGVALQDDSGNLTPEASTFLDLLVTLHTSEAPVGIRPAGAKTEYITNGSTAWQIWNELVQNAERAAARIYLGTDGTLGSSGGAPGVDIKSLFGVAQTKVESDLHTIERGIFDGIIKPWCAINFGDSKLAPFRKYKLPDADADAVRASEATRRQAFYTDIEKARANGFEVSQAFVDTVAKLHDVDAPTLAVKLVEVPTVALAPAEAARVITKNEARAAQGLSPLLELEGQFVVQDAPVPAPQAPSATPSATDALARLSHELVSATDAGHLRYESMLKAIENLLQHSTRDLKANVAELLASVNKDPRVTADEIAEAIADPVAVALNNAMHGNESIITRLLASSNKEIAASVRGEVATLAARPRDLSFAERNASFLGDIKDYAARGFVVDDATVASLAALHGVPVPKRGVSNG